MATGGIERPMTHPGWTLPGVKSAVGAQILLKASGLLPGRDTVLIVIGHGCSVGRHVARLKKTSPLSVCNILRARPPARQPPRPPAGRRSPLHPPNHQPFDRGIAPHVGIGGEAVLVRIPATAGKGTGIHPAL